MSRAVVVGAGVAGLSCAVRLAHAGHRVVVLEQGDVPGGKCARVERDGFRWDSGPSLLTMPWVLRDLFAQTGAPLDDELELLPCEPVTRYRFADGTSVDLHADADRSAAALDAWCPGTGADWLRFLRICGQMWQVSAPLLAGPPPWPPRRDARADPRALLRVRPWHTLRSLARAVTGEPRLRMIIERFATYAGADPRRAPAVLAVAGYVEHAFGAWHPRGGLYAIVEALERRLLSLGGEVRYGTRVGSLPVAGRRVGTVAGVPCDVVVSAVDGEQADRLLGRRVRDRERSLSGHVLLLGLRGRTAGQAHHTIEFPADYDAEFDDVFTHRRHVRDPALYVVCPQVTEGGDDEAWFVLANAPARTDLDWEDFEERVIDRLGVRGRLAARARRSPADLERETGAAPIYGVAPHGRLGTLRRPPNRVRGVENLWRIGGTVHPGGGLPLVMLGAATAAREIGPA